MTVERVGIAMSWSVVAKVARFVAGVAANILIVRSLGKYNWGIVSELKMIMNFAFVIIMLGFGNALLKYIPVVRIKGGLDSFLRNIKKLILIQVVVWIALLVVARFSGDFFGAFFNERFDRFGFYLQFAIGFIIFEIFMTIITKALQSWYEAKRLAIVIIFGNIGYVILLMLFIKLGWGIIGYLTAGAIVNLGMSLLLLPHIGDVIRRTVVREGESPRIGEILRFSLPFVATGILGQIVWRQSEVIFLGRFHGLEAAGFFNLSYSIPQFLLEFIPLSIWPIVLAGASEVYAKNSSDLPRAIDIYYRILFIMVIPVAVMGFAFARPLVPLIYGHEMLPAALLTQMFFVVFSYSFLYTPLSMALYVMGKSWVNMLVFAVLAIINVGLDLAFIPRYGMWGAFYPVAFVLMLGVVIFMIALRRFRADVKVPVSFILRCYAAAVPAGLLSISAARWSSPSALALQIPAGLVLLLLGFRFMKVVGKYEREYIMKLPIPLKERIIAIL